VRREGRQASLLLRQDKVEEKGKRRKKLKRRQHVSSCNARGRRGKRTRSIASISFEIRGEEIKPHGSLGMGEREKKKKNLKKGRERGKGEN